MGGFFAELKRRHIYRVAAAYAVVAWVLLQLFNNLEPILKLPDWTGSLFLALLAAGFPVALLFAWIHHLAGTDGPAARPATGKLDWALIGALIAVLAVVSYQQFAPTTGARTAQQASVAASPSQPGSTSIAVLPFVNLSDDRQQEFFSDGMTDEISAALANVKSLRVIARTSAFQFKGQNGDVRAVGQALGATHVIEGSVRKAGERVRITAQLVKADDGSQLWSEIYDRQLTDIFAIQEDIAQSIAASLRVPLGLAKGDTLVRNRTDDLASYDQYLRAKALYRTRGPANSQAIAILEPLVARDAGFAPAWGLLSYAYTLAPVYSPARLRGSVEEARNLTQTYYDKAEMAARKAIALDSRYSGGYGALADVQSERGRWADGEDLFKQALALDPNDADVLLRYTNMLVGVRRIKEALGLRERLRTLEPTDPTFRGTTAAVMLLDGQNVAAISIVEAVPPSAGRNLVLAEGYAAVARYADAADTLLLPSSADLYSRNSVQEAARIIRSAPAKTSAPESLPAVEGLLNFVYAYVGALPRVMEEYERTLNIGYLGNTPGLWFPVYAPLRKTERFKAHVRKAGLVDYWRARGWPDLCRPMGADDFVCD